MKALVAGLVLAWLVAPVQAAPKLQPMPFPDKSCAPAGGLSFVCGPQRAEDAIAIPDTRWLLISGMTPGSGLGVIDMNAKIAYFLYTAKTARALDRRYPGCSAPPDPASFATHGLSLRATAPGRYRLYVVSHGALESIQVFELNARGDVPALTWKGCVAMPDNHPANSVASFADGTILATVLGGLKLDDGKLGGAVFAWSPGEKMFHWLKGTELPSPNGLEIAHDESEFYVVSSNDQSFNVFSRDGRKLRAAPVPGFNPDNIRWNGNRLVTAGMMHDEPACGGLKVQGGPYAKCHRGYMVAEIDPVGLQWKMIAYAEPNPVFEAVATGAVVGDTLWLTTFRGDRVAYRPLPVPPAP